MQLSCDGSVLTFEVLLREPLKIAYNRPRSSLCHGGLPALRCHVFSCGHSKSDAQIWRMTTLSIYNPQHHRTATSAQFNSFRYAATSSAMFSQRFTIDTRFSAAFAMSAVKQAFPVPTTGSWPEYAARVDLISNSTFQAFVVREKMWPFVVSATLDQTRREGTFRVQLHHSTIIGAASVLSVPLFLALWVSFQDSSVVFWYEEELSMLWQALFASAGYFGGQLWWQSRCIGQFIRRNMADDNAA